MSINESVLLTVRREFGCLNEMFIEGKRNLQDGSHIVAYRSKIWVLPPGSYGEVASKKMQASIAKEIQAKKAGPVKDLGNAGLDERPDILQCIYRKTGSGRATLDIIKGQNYQHNMDTSPLVQKVAKTLGVTNVTMSDIAGNVVQDGDAEDLKAQDPEYGFHGTNSSYLLGILKRGLAPNPGKTNFKDIVHDNTVFLTLDPDKAMFHARTAVAKNDEKNARGWNREHRTNDSGQHTTQPVILRFKIPDKNLIIADFDIDRESSRDRYPDVYNGDDENRKAMPGDSDKLSKHLGVFGYRGRILPQMITDVYIGDRYEPDGANAEASIQDMKRFTARQIFKYLDEFQEVADNFGIENIDMAQFFSDPETYLEEMRGGEDE